MDCLYPVLEALDPPGTEHQTRLGSSNTSGLSSLGSFLHSDAKHRPAYVAPTLSFVCDSNSTPFSPPYVDCLLGGTTGGAGAPLSHSGAVDAIYVVIADSRPNTIQFSMPGRSFRSRNLLLRGCERVQAL